jgi:hypothetical protein
MEDTRSRGRRGKILIVTADRQTELQRAGPVAIDSSRRLSISAGYVAPGKGAEFLNREAHDPWAREERTTPRDNLAKVHLCSDWTAVRECTTCWGFSDGWVGVSFPTLSAFLRSGSSRRPEAEDVDLHFSFPSLAASASQKSRPVARGQTPVRFVESDGLQPSELGRGLRSALPLHRPWPQVRPDLQA